MKQDSFDSFHQFYPYYLSEHSKSGTKIFHFIGTISVIICLVMFCAYLDFIYFLLMPISGYGFAWLSHLFIEKNKPATFRYPLYSLRGDFLMFWHIITGKVKIFSN